LENADERQWNISPAADFFAFGLRILLHDYLPLHKL